MGIDSGKTEGGVPGARRAGRRAALAPKWYADTLGWPVAIEEAIARGRWPRGQGALRGGLRRGLATYLASRDCEVVAVILKEPGTMTFLLLEALLGRGRPRAVVLHFLPRRLPERRWRRALYRAWRATFERFAFRRGMRIGQAVARHDAELYTETYGLDPGRLRYIPWAYSRGAAEDDLPSVNDRSVFCSGRAQTDWETLFGAAKGTDWRITAVCGERDLERVRGLAEPIGAAVHCELPRAEHDRLMRQSAVCVIPLRTGGPSAGHLRVMAAADAGVAVVTSEVPGIADYVTDGETAVLVPPHDHGALREAVERLLDHPVERARLARRARQRARSRTYDEYFAEIDSLLRG